MKSPLTTGGAKRLAISLFVLSALGGCAVVPYNAGYYDQPVYVGPAVYPAVQVAPPVYFNFGYSSGPRHRHRHYRH